MARLHHPPHQQWENESMGGRSRAVRRYLSSTSCGLAMLTGRLLCPVRQKKKNRPRPSKPPSAKTVGTPSGFRWVRRSGIVALTAYRRVGKRPMINTVCITWLARSMQNLLGHRPEPTNPPHPHLMRPETLQRR